MKPLSFMLIAGEASGDLLASELVGALRKRAIAGSQDLSANVQPLQTALAPRFFGAGGTRMGAAGVELAFDLTQHSTIGVSDVLKKLPRFYRMFRQLLRLAIERQPDVIIGVDYGGLNLRLARAIKNYVRRHRREFVPWNPRLVQFVSPQVWASRPGRAYTLAENHDLLLSIFPFEKSWYAKRVPMLRVEYVGHPLIGRSPATNSRPRQASMLAAPPMIVLLPGSRRDEVRRHLPVVIGAFERIQKSLPGARAKMVFPNDVLAAMAKSKGMPVGVEIQTGGLSAALAAADLAITKSGTIAMECAAFGVPAVAFYKTSWPTYFIGRRIVSVRFLSMPNLLAGEEIYPEFVQHQATDQNIANAALRLLQDESRRQTMRAQLAGIIQSLGGPGAPDRAAAAILSLLP